MLGGSRIALVFRSDLAAAATVKPIVERRRTFLYLRAGLPDLLLVWDALSVLLAGVGITGAYCLAHGNIFFFDPAAAVASRGLILTAALGALLSPMLPRPRPIRPLDADAVRRLARRALLLVLLVALVALATRTVPSIPSPWAAGWFAATLLVLLAGRALAAFLLRWSAQRFGGERIAVVGAGPEAASLRHALAQARADGLELVAPGRRAGSLDGVVGDLVEQGRHGALDRVVLAQPGIPDADIRRIAHRLKALRVELASLYPSQAAGACRSTTDLIGIPLFLIAPRPQWGYGGLAKQASDRCLALALLLWMTPLLMLIALAIRLDSPGPALFRQRRHGVNGSEFEIYKFRTMVWHGHAATTGAQQTGRNDRRITRIGRFLRNSSLDEVPQLINVLNGTMSLVGPRPHPTVMRTEARLGEEIVPDYAHRHRVKPGITGWAQVNGLRGATDTADQLRRRVEHDNFYIENWSPWLDLKILARTPASLLFRRDNAF